jgi:hypothetical protein
VVASSLQGEGESGVGCGELSKERGCGEGANGSREGGSRGFWGFIPSARCTSSEMIGWSGRCAGDGMVSRVQAPKRRCRSLAASMGMGSGSVHVPSFRVTARAGECLSMQGKRGAVNWLRCRAGLCAAWRKSAHERLGTRCTLSASTAHAQSRERVGDGLPPTPRPPSCVVLPAFRERGQGGEVGLAWDLQVGYWGSSGATLVAGWG